MRTGLVIYSSKLGDLVSFYKETFGFSVMESEKGFALLAHGDVELVILETEVSITKKVQDTDVAPRETIPIKPTFFIDDYLQNISDKVIANGGGMREPKDWSFGGRLVCDGWDCEGNIFQLRLMNGN